MSRREISGEEAMKSLYAQGFIQTLYNTKSKKHQIEGWVLKSGIWSPWFLNLRPLGDSPELAQEISFAMNKMIRKNVPGLTRIVGIEMAGVPLAASIGISSDADNYCLPIPYAYTRPLPGGLKPRTPKEAEEMLGKMEKPDYQYGQKELVEGTLRSGDVLCITDDMVTDFGSKLIARSIIGYELKRRGIERESVKMDHVAVVLDREQGGEAEAKRHGMQLQSFIKFKSSLGVLESSMRPEEFALVTDYQNDPNKYQNKDLQRETLVRASLLRG